MHWRTHVRVGRALQRVGRCMCVRAQVKTTGQEAKPDNSVYLQPGLNSDQIKAALKVPSAPGATHH